FGGLLLLDVSLTPSDYYYEVMDPPQAGVTEMPRADELLVRSGEADDGQVNVVLIAAAGGGIQAAAWTARVLSGIEAYALERGQADAWRNSLRLLSGVSGGSVGIYYYADRWNDPPEKTAQQLEEVFEAASSSSLEAVAWGLAG